MESEGGRQKGGEGGMEVEGWGGIEGGREAEEARDLLSHEKIVVSVADVRVLTRDHHANILPKERARESV